MEYKVLDYGFVRLIDHMGSDEAIVQAARVSYGDGTKTTSEDRNLIRYMMRHGHTSPFEMAEIKLHCKMPIFVARQWIRHRTASVNELSGRYSIMKEEFYNPNEFRKQSQDNKQGSSKETTKHKIQSYDKVATEYQSLINKDITREQARIVLPLSLYTEWYWKIDLHNLLHFLKLRLSSHAQQEIREYAKPISKIVEKLFPLSWEAFCDYKLEAINFSKKEQKILKTFLILNEECQINHKEYNISKRELKEFQNKLRKISNV